MTDTRSPEVEAEWEPDYYAVHLDCEYGAGNHRIGPFSSPNAAKRAIEDRGLHGWEVRRYD